MKTFNIGIEALVLVNANSYEEAIEIVKDEIEDGTITPDQFFYSDETNDENED